MVSDNTIAIMSAIIHAACPPGGKSEEITVRQTLRLWMELEAQLAALSCGNAMVTPAENTRIPD